MLLENVQQCLSGNPFGSRYIDFTHFINCKMSFIISIEPMGALSLRAAFLRVTFFRELLKSTESYVFCYCVRCMILLGKNFAWCHWLST